MSGLTLRSRQISPGRLGPGCWGHGGLPRFKGKKAVVIHPLSNKTNLTATLPNVFSVPSPYSRPCRPHCLAALPPVRTLCPAAGARRLP